MLALAIRFISGHLAPKYDDGVGLECQEVVITEQGMTSGLPLVDFKMRDANGKLFVLTLTGRHVNALSAAIQGVNLRIHGKAEP